MSVSRSFLIFLLGCSLASAQQPAPAPPGVPIPGATPPPAAGGGGGNDIPENPLPPVNPAIPLGENKITEAIVEPKLSGAGLSVLYRCYTGRRVIVTSAAAAAEFSFVQDASAKDPLSFAQAAELLKKTAILENFVFVPHPNDPKIDVLTLATAVKPGPIGLGTYSDEADLPEGDAVIQYVMKLDYIKPAEAVNTFTAIIGQFGALGSIVPVANASAIVITENTSLIRKLIELKKEIDKPSGQVTSRFIKVQYADVTEIAETLTTLLTAQQSAQTTAGVQRATPAPAAPAPGGAAPAGNLAQASGSGSAGEENPPQIVPEPRTNRIFVMGRPVDIIFIEGLIREFDIPSTEKTFFRRKLRFLTVSQFLPIAGDALTRAFTSTGEGGSAGGGAPGGGASSGGRNQSTGTASSGNRSSSRNSRTSGGSFGTGNSSFGGGGSSFGGGSGGGSFGGGGGGSMLNDPEADSAPESLLVGRTLLVADNITNTVVAQGPPPALEIIERLLDQIDVKPDQIMISTVIGQLALDDTHETGVSYLVNSTDFKAGGGGGFPGLGRLPSTGTGTVTGNTFPEFDNGILTSSGLRAFGQFGDLGVALKALQSKGNFTVLSRPSIFTSNNKKGMISSGERIAIPTQGGYNSGGYSSGTSIQYQDVVLKLEVNPLVNDNNTITMEIALLNDEQNGVQTLSGAGTGGEPLEVPRISTREIVTTATVPNNNTIVLGGLIVNKDENSKSGIPILSDIPGLGRLFSNNKLIKNRSELMVFIQPSIVNSDRSLNEVQASMDNRYKVSPKARNFSDGPGVLPAVDEIPVVENTGKNGNRAPKATPVDESPMPPSSRPATGDSMLPIFRR
jgi:general secretion pathway protein D